MKISELQEPIKSWALENQRNADESWGKDTNDLWYAFEWHNTTQGHGFWNDVYDGTNLEHLKQKYPDLDWGEKIEKDQPKKLWEWMKLFEEGVELEYVDDYEDFNKIHTINELIVEFENRTIRIKPQPKKVVLYGSFVDGFAGWQDGKDTHRITFELDEKGNPICETVKMEEIKNQKTK